MYGIMLIVVLVITGGAIAVIGDRVGTKVGKKKLSLFGMRPRHTSILVTIITGICITTLTFIILAAASENVRTALFGMEKLNQRMAETQQRLGEAESAKARAAEDLRVAQGEVTKLQEQQSGLEQRAKELSDGNAELEAAKQLLTEQNKSLSEGNVVLERSNVKLLADNRELEQRAAALREDVLTVREGDITFRAGEILASKVVKGNRSLEEVQADMGGLMARANQFILQRLGEEDGKDGVWIYRPEFEQACEYIAEGKEDAVVRLVAAGNLVRGEPVRSTFELFRNSIVYNEGEVIQARPYDWQGNDNGEAQSIIMSFLREINHAAQAKGILADPISGAVGVIEGSQLYEITAELSRQPAGRVVISAYAKADTDVMGPLRLILKVERE